MLRKRNAEEIGDPWDAYFRLRVCALCFVYFLRPSFVFVSQRPVPRIGGRQVRRISSVRIRA